MTAKYADQRAHSVNWPTAAEREKAGKGAEGFYVSVRDGNHSGLLLGPYTTKADAESDIPTGRKIAKRVNSRAIWYAYGVTRVVMQPGAALPKAKLNQYAAQTAREGSIMTYRDRREARAERLQEWAAKRETRAAAVFRGRQAVHLGLSRSTPSPGTSRSGPG